MKEITEEQLKALTGLELEEARKRVEGMQHQFHILSRDGCALPVVGGFRRNRVGVNITRGKVTSAVVG